MCGGSDEGGSRGVRRSGSAAVRPARADSYGVPRRVALCLRGSAHPEATAAAEVDGWFRTGDIGVIHEDGYLELLDRSKDVIISGGENISSIEVEGALASHPAVLECAVVAGPDDYWGEVPVAFVTLHADAEASEGQLVDHVKKRIASFKAPKQVVFGSLPKTATGKVQKFVLREHLRTGR